MHKYLEEYFNFLYDIKPKYIFDREYDWYKLHLTHAMTEYEWFIENASMCFYDYDLEKIVENDFPHIKLLYQVYCDDIPKHEPIYKRHAFYSIYSILKKYEKELNILLRKEKLKKLMK